MLTRFTGEEGQRRLREALELSAFIGGDATLADLIASSVTVFEVPRGDVLITEGASDDDLYLILSGQVVVYVRNREIALRRAGQYVGEMALIDPMARRSATVVAAEPCVVGKITGPAFSNIADKAPVLWRRL